MADNVVLRRYRPADLDPISRLDEVCFAAHFQFNRTSMRRFAEARHAITLIAEEERAKTVGFVIVHLERTLGSTEGYVITLDVSPDKRRSGIAGLLMDEAERLAGSTGVRRMRLHVSTENDAAIRFYESRNYARAGLRRRFYGVANGVEMDAFEYRKELQTT
jgi:ribosomal-protein-alanine N-acetyltransferase